MNNCAREDSAASKSNALIKIIISKMRHKHLGTLVIGHVLRVRIISVNCFSKMSWKVHGWVFVFDVSLSSCSRFTSLLFSQCFTSGTYFKCLDRCFSSMLDMK